MQIFNCIIYHLRTFNVNNLPFFLSLSLEYLRLAISINVARAREREKEFRISVALQCVPILWTKLSGPKAVRIIRQIGKSITRNTSGESGIRNVSSRAVPSNNDSSACLADILGDRTVRGK